MQNYDAGQPHSPVDEAYTVHSGAWLSLDPRVAYGIAQLRLAVFAMEQGITDEPELDGVDLEDSTTTYWAACDGVPVSTLRVMTGKDGSASIGRVATLQEHRGLGLARRLMGAAIAANSGRPIHIHAQAYLERWYEQFGFRTTGPAFDEVGIPHLPMTREPSA